MTTFTVWKFDDPQGADRAVAVLRDAAAEHLVRIDDHAVVRWSTGAARPTVDRGHRARHSAGRGTLWGLLIGTLFLVPLAGGVAGAAIGTARAAMNDAGITDDQLERIRTEVTEGTSALFLVTEEGDLDRLGERFPASHSRLIATNLTEAEREILYEAFGGR
ncbi:DUF1269 domain-containing protein [Pseudosporangium ferrugineum]|uniref:Putative membrane protein n=1 Tax=Pseudosporangium ferrugineum TaxID=439699 RepID=A0A2T0SBQ2_9ACTN|nr:DUF1269 domain-containing protein [Pseudosporangium ferrugineum]PRY30850.1 putative membrane protein [Pseudosporangium ferrugineum]